MKRLLCALICIAFALTACGRVAAPLEAEAEVAEIFAMDTYMKLVAYGDGARAALGEATAEILHLEKLWSVTIETSDIAKLNALGAAEVAPETRELLAAAVETSELVGGAFDVTVFPVGRAWGFTTGTHRVPEGTELSELLLRVGSAQIEFDGAVVRTNGAELDLGAIAKGAAAQRVVDLLRERGIQSAIISLGGNVQTLGAKPNGEPWSIAVQDPRNTASYIGTVKLVDLAAVTSGGYQRFFEQNGIVYHHIIDPKTGRPADSGLISATIVTADGALADALSTAAFVLGFEDSVELWRSGKIAEFEMILIESDGRIHVTEGLTGDFTAVEGSFEIIARQRPASG